MTFEDLVDLLSEVEVEVEPTDFGAAVWPLDLRAMTLTLRKDFGGCEREGDEDG